MALSSIGLGGWLIYEEVNPWAAAFWQMSKIEAHGSPFYPCSAQASSADDSIKRAYVAAKQGTVFEALSRIAAGRREYPKNAIFDYLEAYVELRWGDIDGAFRAVDAGNRRGTIHLYGNRDVRPARWHWPEFSFVCHLADRLAEDAGQPGAGMHRLESLLQMGQVLVWSWPPDVMRLMQAVEARQAAAKKLDILAKRNGQPRLATLCERLIEEARMVRSEISWRSARESVMRDDARAWILGRAIGPEDSKLQDAAALVRHQKQAEYGLEIRQECLRIRELKY